MKKWLLFSIVVLMAFFVAGAIYTRVGKQVPPSPKPLVFSPPKTNIVSPDGVTYSFFKTPSYANNLPVYSSTAALLPEIETAIFSVFPIFKTATSSSLFRENVLTKTWALPARDLTITYENQDVVVSAREQGGSSSVLIPPTTAIKNIFSSLGISRMITITQEPQDASPIEGLLILDPQSTSVTAFSFSYKIGEFSLFVPNNPGSPASAVVDNLGVLRVLSVIVPPKDMVIEKNELLIAPEDILQNLRAGRGVIITGNNPETTGSDGGLTFSSFVIDGFEIVYSKIMVGVYAPAFLLHGYGSLNNGRAQEATFFVWATRYQPIR